MPETPETASSRILINTVAGTLSKVGSLLVLLLSTPILVNALGERGFGTYSILTAAPAYIVLLDFGIGTGLVRHLSQASIDGSKQDVRRILTLGLLFYVGLGAVLGVLAAVSAPALVAKVTSDEYAAQELANSIYLVLAFIVVSGIGGVFNARLVSIHRMDLASGCTFLGQIFYCAAMLMVFSGRSISITAAVMMTLVPAIISGALAYFLVVKFDKAVLANPMKIPGPRFREICAFGGWMQLNGLTAVINLEADKIIIASYLSVDLVTPYQIGNRLATLSRIVPFQILAAIAPQATLLQSVDQKTFAVIYRRYSRYVMLASFFSAGLLLCNAELVILTWMGKPFPLAVSVLWALTLTFLLNNLTGCGTTILRAVGSPRLESYYGLVSMVANVTLTLLLAPWFGLIGVLAGTVCANVIGTFYFLILFHRSRGISWYQVFEAWFWKLLFSTVVTGALVRLSVNYLAPAAEQERFWNIGVLLSSFCLFAVLLPAVLYVLGFWEREDRRFLSEAVGGRFARFRAKSRLG